MCISVKIKVLLACWLTLLPLIVYADGNHVCKVDSIPATTPSSRFINNNNGTITDNTTGLIWKICIEGQSGSGCNDGINQIYSWAGALTQVQIINTVEGGFANHTDWRLPNIKELLSIVERQCQYPAINLTIFPNTMSQTSEILWSSSPYLTTSPGYGTMAYSLHLYSGAIGVDEKSSDFYVRLVRGGH